ncbi:RNA helicase [Malassezia yamatoensis]|uniref:RNA helicase n=1 Tax=Malassezia yamatoensis TaxID=253288 RepID=A0AAJ5YUH1_9BASI|nr:RNA helicase [Malassezia yamatoensis]
MAAEIDFLVGDPVQPPSSRRKFQQKTTGVDSDDDAAFIAEASQRHNVKAGTEVAKQAQKGKGKAPKIASGVTTGGGSFQSMAIPAILAQPPQDVVGMARTGSGKTLSYMVPLIQRLNGRHSTSFGVKSIIICPSRELAMQILRVGKDVARGWRGDDHTQNEPIRWALIVGGESLDQQFAIMAGNPDVVIATPGRMLHLVVEMNMDLKAVEYVVFDEADRLFEMGFAEQLEELLRRLPPSRQTLLFSATLPKSLVEFARAGLDANPKLIRLDADSKISPELRMAFFSVKPSEKESALLLLLRHIIQVPIGQVGQHGDDSDDQDDDYEDQDDNEDNSAGDKRKRFSSHRSNKRKRQPVVDLKPYQTIIFCATKHHVEYLLLLLTTIGYACSHIYSSLDQAARAIQMSRFRSGRTSLLIVTDLAARGIDLPVLEHVVNYDFPPQPRIFVHRVGRTARAGRRGWAWNLVTPTELPYLCDLQLFLGRPLVSSHTQQGEAALDLQNSMVLGTFPREQLDQEVEHVKQAMHESSSIATAYDALVPVVKRAQNMYVKSQPKASQESFRRAKDMLKDAERSSITGRDAQGWALAGHPLEAAGVHDVLQRPTVYNLGDADLFSSPTHDDPLSKTRASLLAKINSFRPGETVFELGTRGPNAPLAQLMQDRRKLLDTKQRRARAIEETKTHVTPVAATTQNSEQDEVDEEQLEALFDTGKKKEYRDPNFYMGYVQEGADEDRGYSLNSSFAEQAKHVAVDLGGDDIGPGHANQRPNQSRWDTKKKKFVKGDGAGADNQKMIRTETGLKLPASFRSGRFEEWRKEQRLDMPKVGEDEGTMPASARRVAASTHGGAPSHRHRGFHHTSTKAPKPLEKLHYDYKRKLSKRQGRASSHGPPASRNELKSAQQIQREREQKAKRMEKNARPSRRKKP